MQDYPTHKEVRARAGLGEDKAQFGPRQDEESADVQLRAFLGESG